MVAPVVHRKDASIGRWDVFTASVLAFCVTLVLEPLLIRRLTAHGVLDIAGVRSSHTMATPRGGGIAVIAGLLVGVVAGRNIVAIALLGGILIAAAVGAVEDLRGVGIAPRLLLTSFAALALVAALTLAPLPSGLLGVLIILIAVPWTMSVVNATNFMDGINGISAATAIVGGACFAVLGLAAHSEPLAVLGAASAAAAAGFAPYNAPRARVFLGDVGSYGLGAAFAAMSLLAVTEGLRPEAAVAPLALYLADTGVTIARRVYAGEPWHLPHKRHVYQRLVALGLPHLTVSTMVAVLTAACGGLGVITLVGSNPVRLTADVGILAVLAGYLALPRLLTVRGRRSETSRRFAESG
jgi:UDP-GlcNAc:undecaprenyl-phosphate/decaprenyl-phosphate GlcNAc-1-phosphate transferase